MNYFPGGVWPVMLTPFTKNNQIDYDGLEKLIEWYLLHDVDGMFAVCQSSEMFYLTLDERVKLAKFVVNKVNGRVPVIASGHISDSIDGQIEELNLIARTGVDAVILITNRLAKENEDDSIWISNLEKLLDKIPEDVKLGLYECPYPYKRIMSEKTTRWCAENGRFYFLKDTSCDIDNIKLKLKICKGSNLNLYNANTVTLLESLRLGAKGYCGVMANIHPRLYAKLCRDFMKEECNKLQELLTMCALIERQCYPANAKYYLQLAGLELETKCRSQDDSSLTSAFRKEVKILKNISESAENKYLQ